MRPAHPEREHPDARLHKVWRLECSDPAFAQHMDKRCDGSHPHVRIEGQNTKPSENYPEKFAVHAHDYWNEKMKTSKGAGVAVRSSTAFAGLAVAEVRW